MTTSVTIFHGRTFSLGVAPSMMLELDSDRALVMGEVSGKGLL